MNRKEETIRKDNRQIVRSPPPICPAFVASKGSAAPVANMPSRTPAHARETAAEDAANNSSAEFPRCRESSAMLSHACSAHDLKLNELRMAFDDYEKKQSWGTTRRRLNPSEKWRMA